ncbi:adp-ribosylation factor gtpase-activating protein [Anaeramoeba ignava]|uniref:Adp-ribosylation factor gtpase-activating protein n=1 Tax=Anaeramoeba ignava TaxID=1746090 RepID=A0A9Q0LAN4_ANAIG|nr:adp-ribosylation factor gtpase-activating protein [Anaeramoeba ignava]
MSKPDSKELEALLKLPENRYCADCKTPGPRWASVNLGIFVCINCSGIHRAMGVHISQVRSVTLDTWTREQYDTAKSIGNEKANEYWEAKLPSGFKRPNSSDMFSLEKFIRDKYERKLYIQKKKKNRPKKKIHTRKSPSKVSDSKKSQKPKKKIVLKKPVSNQETNDKIQNQKETLVNFKDNSQERSNSTQPNNTFNLMNEFTDLSMNHAQRRSEPNISQLKSQQNSMQNNADSLILLEPTQPTFGVNQQNNQKKNLILSMFDSPNKFPTTQPIMNQQSANRVTRSKKKTSQKSKTKTKKT